MDNCAEFLTSRLWEKMVGNDWENSLNAPNSSKSLPNCPKMSQNAHFRRIVVRTDLLRYWTNRQIAFLHQFPLDLI